MKTGKIIIYKLLTGPHLLFSSLNGDQVCVQNNHLNIHFWFNTSVCKEPITYRISVKTRTFDGGSEPDGRVLRQNSICVVKYSQSNALRCSGKDGPATLSRALNDTHKEIVWSWSWNDYHSQKLMSNETTIKLNMSCKYLPSKRTFFTCNTMLLHIFCGHQRKFFFF